ncbi:MAG: hypothetical protein AAGF30_00470 [Pseudomonadota bacterium]
MSARRLVATCEILCAVRLAAFGDWWAARARVRLGKLSGEHSRTPVVAMLAGAAFALGMLGWGAVVVWEVL